MSRRVGPSKGRWVFFGRVLPERFSLRIDQGMSWTAHPEGFDLSFDFNLGIVDGHFTATATITQGETDLHSLRNFVVGNIRTITDAVGYLSGLSLDVDLIY